MGDRQEEGGGIAKEVVFEINKFRRLNIHYKGRDLRNDWGTAQITTITNPPVKVRKIGERFAPCFPGSSSHFQVVLPCPKDGMVWLLYIPYSGKKFN